MPAPVPQFQVMGTAFFGEDELQFATLDRAMSCLFFALMGEVQWESIEAWLSKTGSQA